MAVVLITGCSSGFGKLAALEFARRGDNVFASMRNTAKARPLQDAANEEKLDVNVVELDVTKTESANRAVKDVLARAGRIDVLVNNAGVGTHGPIEDYDDDEVEAIFDTNLLGVVRVTRAALPALRAQGSGHIINVSSLAGVVTAPFGGVYSASKHALESLSDALYYELHPFGIRVSIVEPGGFETEFSRNHGAARRFNEGSAYVQLERRFAEASSRLPGAGGAADPQIVANMIVDAAHAAEPKRRYLAGQDAQLIGQLHKQASDEDFEKAMRTTLDFWD